MMEKDNQVSISSKLEMDEKHEPMLKICLEFMHDKRKAIKEFVTILILIIVIIVLVVVIIFTR